MKNKGVKENFKHYSKCSIHYFGDKKVKIISSMGEQSCGKSFMLNHLIGTTFDASAMVNTILKKNWHFYLIDLKILILFLALH